MENSKLIFTVRTEASRVKQNTRATKSRAKHAYENRTKSRAAIHHSNTKTI